MSDHTAPTYLSPAVAIEALLRAPEDVDTILQDAVQQFGDEALATAVVDGLVAPDLSLEAMEGLLPPLMLLPLSESNAMRLCLHAIDAAAADDPRGPILVVNLVLAGLEPTAEFAEQFSKGIRNLIADMLASLETEEGFVDEDALERVREALLLFRAEAAEVVPLE